MSRVYKPTVKLLTITPNGEQHIADCGRTCYESYDKAGEASDKKLIRHLLKSGHHSVLEHASATFRVGNVSRSLTHQCVRHRIASYSQKSQRYVKEKNFDYVLPDAILTNEAALYSYEQCMENIELIYNELVSLGIRKEDARYVLPNACTTTIDITMNFRSFINFINLRGDSHAQWEIRQMTMAMLAILKEHAPTVFENYENDWGKEIIRRVEK